MIPQTRTDLFLAKITGEDVALPVPHTRFELYLANIAGESYELPAPNSRATLYLAKILGQDVELPQPQTRSELYLASIAGMSVQLPEAPQTREEWYLARWAENAAYVVITGNPVSFQAVAAKLRQLKVAFAPVQDLHGYDSPWPAGGGANKYGGSKLKADLLAVSGSSAGSDSGGAYVSLSSSSALNNVTLYDGFAENTQYTFIYKINVAGGTGANIRVYYTDNTYQTFSVPADGDTFYAAYTTTAGKTVSKLSLGYWYTTTVKVYYDSFGIFDGSVALADFTPYENECPIYGWTGVNVWQAGKNLFDKNSAEISDGWWYAPDMVVGEPLPRYAGSPNYHTSAPIPVNPGQTYSVVGCGGGNGSFLYLDRNFNYVDGFPNFAQSSLTFTVPDNPSIAYLRFPFSTATEDTCQLELGSAASAYEPYDDRLIPVVFPDGETYYSGWVDPTTGGGVVDRFYGHLTEMLHNWGFSTVGNVVTVGYYQYVHYNGELMNWPAVAASPGLMCNTLPIKNVIPGYQNPTGITFNVSGFYIALRLPINLLGIDETATAAQRKAAMDTWLTNNPTYVCYKLATPIEIQLTPQQINSLAGPNTMWSDANGDLTVEYWKDGNVSDVEALSLLLGGRYTPAQSPEDVPDREALRIITGR